MIFSALSLLISLVTIFFAAPPMEIPPQLWAEYTLNDQIPVAYCYFDHTPKSNAGVFYSKEEVDQLIYKALRRESWYYGETDQALYKMLDRYKAYIEGKRIGIIGSATPWYEAIILAYGGNPVTIEYNPRKTDDLRLTLLTVDEFEKNPIVFDAILSISSIEHDGLGRYGDPINPWGDIESMQAMKEMLKSNGLLFIAFPFGQDCLLWNAHRVYGEKRLPLLFEGWQRRDFAPADFQPVFVLEK